MQNNVQYIESEGNLQKRAGPRLKGSVVDEKIYYTDPESNQQTHHAHSCKQNITATTPFNFIVAVPLALHDTVRIGGRQRHVPDPGH
jgi:hypothetical protein